MIYYLFRIWNANLLLCCKFPKFLDRQVLANSVKPKSRGFCPTIFVPISSIMKIKIIILNFRLPAPPVVQCPTSLRALDPVLNVGPDQTAWSPMEEVLQTQFFQVTSLLISELAWPTRSVRCTIRLVFRRSRIRSLVRSHLFGRDFVIKYFFMAISSLLLIHI